MLSVLRCNLNVRVLPILVGVDHKGDSLLVDLASLHPVLVLSYIDLIAKLIVEHNSLKCRADRMAEALDVSPQS